MNTGSGEDDKSNTHSGDASDSESDDDLVDQLSLRDRLILALRDVLFGGVDAHHPHGRSNAQGLSGAVADASRFSADSAPPSPRGRMSASMRAAAAAAAAAAAVSTSASVPTSVRGSPTPFADEKPSIRSDSNSNPARPRGLRSYVEVQAHGGASVVHVYPADAELLSTQERALFAEACLEEILSEDPITGLARHVIGIVHQGGADLPNHFRMLVRDHPATRIVREAFGQKNMSESTQIADYANAIDASFSHGTHRAGGMRPISMVGCFQEELGGYFPEHLALLESNPFLRVVMPWGPISVLKGLRPQDSNDGPILWVRPGEQVVALSELGATTPDSGRRRGGDATTGSTPGRGERRKKDQLEYLYIRPRVESPREKLVEDRTGCHADHAGLIPFRHTVAAVGLLQPVSQVTAHGRQSQHSRSMQIEDARVKGDSQRLAALLAEDEVFMEASVTGAVPTTGVAAAAATRMQLQPTSVIACKDVIAFHAESMQTVENMIGLDYNEEPADQLLDPQLWVEDAKLNQMRRSGIKHARVRLDLGDIYFIPRRVVHQFKTVAASVSVTWHLRYKRYREFADNLEMGVAAAAGSGPGMMSNGAPRKRSRMSSMKSMR
ncbi:hypothetical protein CAOG_04281 [Capsaspora owczarzaki ATCC 30864]|uniref:Uncharacterized protein n=1 Tax=Capsaspora owczarzaki (strain ATCC 30864) TaxID=595528 RepID=A0A0D2WQX8_CAPO3|nr:hypothetical protein CAOG_04281 [Capsaspora owczarzaki ATCC 30864]KJE93498.1 hypothetical protein CAOG_004281 [Capsaspora owczarzaki ATCC 30864]|eukprot:XP_004348106.1 hypothetical protein CAOG_04281 [Capsaspora owczarzaki ATCC 30864]